MSLLFTFTLRVTALLITAFLVVFLSRNRSAAFRHWILTAALLASAMVPALILINPRYVSVALPHSPAVTSPAPTIAVKTGANDAGVSGTVRPDRQPTTPEQTHAATRVQNADSQSHSIRDVLEIAGTRITPAAKVPVGSILFYIWLAGTLAGLVSLVAGIVQMQRLTADSIPVTAGRWVRFANEVSASYRLRRPVGLKLSRDGAMLATWGFLHPALLLPAGSEDWPDERLRVVLHHEFAHVRRNDWIIQILSELVRAVYWFDPVCWLVNRRLVQESEQACDDMALNCGIPGSDYAEQLLALALPVGREEQHWRAALHMARLSTFENRFAAILNSKVNRSAVTQPGALATAMAFAAIALALMVFRVSTETARTMMSAAPSQNSVRELPQTTGVSSLQSALLSLVSQITPLPATSAALHGTVVRLGSNEPISGASIELRKIECGESGIPPEVYTALTGLPNPYWTTPVNATTPPEIFTAATGNDGKFAFANLSAGSYCMVAYRAAEGYLSAEYQQRGYRGRGVTLTITNGQQIQDVKLALPPTGSISGRVLDNHDQPVAHAQVQALEPYYQDGERRLNVVMSMQTNDLGEFRLFWLPPGRYYLAATLEDPERRTIHFTANPTGRSGRLEVMTYPVMSYRELEDGSVQEEASTYVYFGGATDSQKATLIDVGPGANVGGMDIAFGTGRVRSWRVRGKVTNGANGQPVANASVRLIPPKWLPNPVIPSGGSDANGVFDISGVTPGTYYLWATGRGAGARGGARADYNPIPVPELIARVPIAVTGADINNVSVVMNPGFTITGHVTIEGRSASESASDMTKVRVRPLRDPDILGQPAALLQDPVPSEEDGRFTINGIGPGDYRVYVEPLLLPARILPPPMPPSTLQGMYVKSIRLGNADLLSQGLHIGLAPEGQMEVVLGKGSQIRGRAFNDGRQQPMVNVTVVLIPDAPMRQRGDRYKTARTDTTGQFFMQGIAPGDYKIFAWEEIEDGIWMNADFMRVDETRGKIVHIEEGRSETLDVTVIRR